MYKLDKRLQIDDKLIFTIDSDAFFASAEELRRPELKDTPFVVGHELNGRGIVVTASYKAREFGIKAGMPLFKARKLLKDIKLVETDHEWYVEVANEVFNVILNYSDKVQVASIDECFIDVTHLTNKYKPIELAKIIQYDIKNKVGISTSVGISTNLILSKVASNFDKPNGVSTLFKHEIPAKLWPLDIGEMHMIGSKTSEALKKFGIETIGDLAKSKNDFELYNRIKQNFGINIDKLIDSVNGLSSDVVRPAEEIIKSISKDETFEVSYTDVESLKLTARNLFDFAIYRAKRRKLVPKGISISIKLDKSFNRASISKTLPYSTLSKEVLWPIVDDALEKLVKKNDSIKFCSISLDNLSKEEKIYQQMELEDDFKATKPKLQSIADSLTLKTKADIFIGSTMKDNYRYEEKEAMMNDNVKFKVWEK